jgi:hypothetical protein
VAAGGEEEEEEGGGAEEEPAVAAAAEEEEEEEAGDVFTMPPLPDPVRFPEQGVLPRVIRNLVMERRKVKAEEKKERDPAKKASLDIRQKALKILANSMYGCLGFSSSRFYAKPIAALVTSQGREILQNTVDLATNNIGESLPVGEECPPGVCRPLPPLTSPLLPPSPCRPGGDLWRHRLCDDPHSQHRPKGSEDHGQQDDGRGEQALQVPGD